MKQHIRVGLYTRESTLEQAEKGYNLDMQNKAGTSFVENLYIDFSIKLYEEAGKSSLTLNRPRMNELIDDVTHDRLDVICIYKLDRLIRKVEHWFILKPLFEKHNVTIISVCDDIDTSTAIGKFNLILKLALAEFEQDQISERTNTGLKEGAEQGNFIKGGKTSFGYERIEKNNRKTLKVVEEEKAILLKMRDYLRSGFAPYYISLVLQEDKDLQVLGKKFNERQITRMLTDKLYCGIMELKGKEYILDYEPIFTLEELEEHKEIIKSRSKTTKYKYLFENKVFTNDDLPATKQSTLKKSGEVLYYFDTKHLERLNEKKILDSVLDYLQTSEHIYTLERNRKYETDIKQLTKKKHILSVLYKTNKIYFDKYIRELEKINNETKLVKQLHSEYVDNLHAYFNNLTYDEKVILIHKNIKRIEVDFITKQVISIQ